ncbi:MAG: Abi family protein [Prevotellaceae bacterium]|jgi:abortive infection bacteriophage resistance protein|nr:Abi family protein [Prevotellaceae bacterium]
MKQATTVEQQLKILTDPNRGMIIDIDYKKAKEILCDIGYFRLGFYCFPFETTYPNCTNRSHQYKKGTKFSDVVNLYYFDVDLRNILSKYINRIEINFRTNIIYRVSNQYIHSNTWFIDNSVMEKSFIDRFDKEFYTDNFKKNPIIKRHHEKYINDKYAPAWKTLEFFTFGAMLNLYKNLKNRQIRQEIAAQYNINNAIKSDSILENYFNCIVEIRNLCAHGNVLFDHKLNRRLVNGPAIKITNNSFQLYSAIKVIQYVLKSVSDNRANDFQKEIDNLFDKYKKNDVLYSLISSCVGLN